jgi:hypothetical protein
MVISGLNYTAFDLAVYASQRRSPGAPGLARLCRTGLVTRRVSMKGFTLRDDSPFPRFLAQGHHTQLSIRYPGAKHMHNRAHSLRRT